MQKYWYWYNTKCIKNIVKHRLHICPNLTCDSMTCSIPVLELAWVWKVKAGSTVSTVSTVSRVSTAGSSRPSWRARTTPPSPLGLDVSGRDSNEDFLDFSFLFLADARRLSAIMTRHLFSILSAYSTLVADF